MNRRQVQTIMRRHDIPGEVSGRGDQWEVELPDEDAKRLFERAMKGQAFGGYRTGYGGWVLSPDYQSKGDWNDPSSRHHYANLRSATLKLAGSRPAGDPLRRKLLALLQG